MTLISEFEKAVRRFPEHIALISEREGKMTYRELERHSNSVAQALVICIPDNEKIVGIYLERSFQMIAVLLGILKAGKAYLPLDVSYPQERLKLMMEFARLHTIVCNGAFPMIREGIRCLDFSALSLMNEFEPHPVAPDDPACILFTSGSTGIPQGVMISHRSILNTLTWAIAFYKLSEIDVSLQIPSCSFVSSLQDIFTTLLSGGTLLMIKDTDLLNTKHLRELINRYRVTHFDMVPSLYREYIQTLDSGTTLRFVLLAGEPLGLDLVKKHFTLFPHVRLVNEYGMSETSSCFSYYEMFPDSSRVKIGQPIDGMFYFLEDEDSEGIGELYIGGSSLALGYYNNPELTQEKFRIVRGERYFKTGDYVQMDSDGFLIYVGRRDNQMKVNGKRVHLSEIDYVLSRIEGILHSQTLGILVDEHPSLVSFIQTKASDLKPVWESLKSCLPPHYIPNHLIPLLQLPKLPNGKLNTEALKNYFFSLMKRPNVDATADSIRQIIERISAGILITPEEHTDLRMQGVDSITFIRLLAEFENEFGVDMEIEFWSKEGMFTLDNIRNYCKSQRETANASYQPI